MTNFRTTTHWLRPDIGIVEILVDGKVAAVIYPFGDKGIKLVSVHLKDVRPDENFEDRVIYDDGTGSMPPIPSVLVTFDPRPYEIRGGKIVRLNQG